MKEKSNRTLIKEMLLEQIHNYSEEINYEESFKVFWKLYPVKANKHDARLAWEKQVKKIGDPNILIDYLQKYIMMKEAQKTRKEFVPNWPHANRWLSKEYWQDLEELAEEHHNSPIHNMGHIE